MKTQKYDIVGGFNTIASGYDLANDAMTFGLHRKWRADLIKLAVKLCPAKGKMLDLATGTGDVAIGIAQKSAEIKISAVDPAVGMLELARRKADALAADQQKQIEFEVGDALGLRFPDNSFDIVTIAWGIRNVLPYSQGLKEILRVLKPGGHLLVLESGQPEYKIVGAVYKLYSKLLPYIGGLISGYKAAYQYYVKSADEFPGGKRFVVELYKTGYKECGYKTLGFGMIFLYQAQKPPAQPT